MREPVHYPGAFLVEHADIPPELTIAQWREQRARERREQHADRREAARARRRALLVALLTFGRRGGRAAGQARAPRLRRARSTADDSGPPPQIRLLAEASQRA